MFWAFVMGASLLAIVTILASGNKTILATWPNGRIPLGVILLGLIGIGVSWLLVSGIIVVRDERKGRNRDYYGECLKSNQGDADNT